MVERLSVRNILPARFQGFVWQWLSLRAMNRCESEVEGGKEKLEMNEELEETGQKLEVAFTVPYLRFTARVIPAENPLEIFLFLLVLYFFPLLLSRQNNTGIMVSVAAELLLPIEEYSY